jgi:hypothetical protein
MLFRRQDIPKTTRAPKGGGTRRVYPRFIRDQRQMPKIDLAIEYLNGMVGQRRADLSQQTVLELLGDPKLARCLLACLGDYFHYVTPTFEEVVGAAKAQDLLEWNFESPADLRAFVYRLANDRQGGFVTIDRHNDFLSELAAPLGLDADTLFQLLHLDADRNAIFTQRRDKPTSIDVVASYNANLILSTLRQASRVRLSLHGVSDEEIESCCARHGVVCRVVKDSSIELTGVRDSHGSYSRHGRKLARCVHQLVLGALAVDAIEATVYLNDRPLHLDLDQRTIAFLRPQNSYSSDVSSIRFADAFLEQLSAHRAESGSGRAWTFRRLPDCRVLEGALVLPEIVAVRDRVSIDLIFANKNEMTHREHEALRSLAERFSLLIVDGNVQNAVSSAQPAEVLEMIDRIYSDLVTVPELSSLLDGMLVTRPYVPASELLTLTGVNGHHRTALCDSPSAVFLPDLGLFQRAKYSELAEIVNAGAPQIAVLRAAVADRFGEEVADALTIRLLSDHQAMAIAA